MCYYQDISYDAKLKVAQLFSKSIGLPDFTSHKCQIIGTFIVYY